MSTSAAFAAMVVRVMPAIDQAQAWTTYWRQSAVGGGCLPSAPADVAMALQKHWRSVAGMFTAGSRLIDLGCGAGAVAHLIAEARPGVEVTGVDFSHVPPSRAGGVVLHSGVRMESLPFADGAFDGAVSQFGIEYSDVPRAAAELARVLKAAAPVSFAVHRSGSPVTAHNRRRSGALQALTSDELGSAFVSGDRGALCRALDRLLQSYRDQDVVAEFSTGLSEAIAMAPAQRRGLWAELSAKVTHERAILDALDAAAVKDMAEWLRVFEPCFSFGPPRVIADSRGAAFAWAVTGGRL